MKWPSLHCVMACTTPQHQLLDKTAAHEHGDEILSATLNAFVSAAEQRDFSTVYEYLSSNWRTRYSVQRLEADFESEPLSLFRLQHAANSSSGWIFESATVASKEWQPGKKLKLVLESAGWKVAALE
jgi:hypothetical protein